MKPHISFLIPDASYMEAALTAHAMTSPIDAMGIPYHKAFSIDGAQVIVKSTGGYKRVIITSTTPLLACVPATHALSRGLVTVAPNASWQAFSSEASGVVTNASPPAPAPLAGATLTSFVTGYGVDMPATATVTPGIYDSVKHPGDTSWHSADGKTVISWWAGGRYITSAQVFYGFTKQLPKWVDLDALADGAGLCPVLDGTLPQAIRSLTDTQPAIQYYAGTRTYDALATQYGVWKNGALWHRSKPALAHMAREIILDDGTTTTELVSLCYTVAMGAGSMGVRFSLRTTSSQGQHEVLIDLPQLSAAQGALLDTTTEAGSWLFHDWHAHTCVVYDALDSDGNEDIYYPCYGIFSPDGTKLLIYGTTTGPDFTRPWLFDSHVAADYRLAQVFVCSVPATLSSTIVMQHSEDAPPSTMTQTSSSASASTPSVPAEQTCLVTRLPWVWTGSAGGGIIQGYSRLNCVVSDASTDTVVYDYGIPTVTWGRTTDEIIPYVDWSPDSAHVIAPRKVFTTQRVQTVTDFQVSRYRNQGSITLQLAEGTSFIADPLYDYTISFGGVGAQAAATPLPSSVTVSTTVRDYHADGSYTDTTSSASLTPASPQGGQPFNDYFGLPADAPPFGNPSLYYNYSNATVFIRTYLGQELAVEEAWNRSPLFTYAGQITAQNVPTHKSNVVGTHWNVVSAVTGVTTVTTQTSDDDTASVAYRIDCPSGVRPVTAMTDTVFYENTYHRKLVTVGATTTTDENTQTLAVTPTWTEVQYLEPRWPVMAFGSERLYSTHDSEGNSYYPGTLDGGVRKELVFDAPVSLDLEDSLPSVTPGYSYALVTPPTAAVGEGRSQEKFGSMSIRPATFTQYVPTATGTFAGTYLTGTRAAPRAFGNERVYHYDISPDVTASNKVLFGLPYWDAAWPNGWGTTTTTRKPALWLADGKKLPLAVRGVYGDGVTYSVPVFLKAFAQL